MWTPRLIGQAESRLLALERRQVYLESQTRNLQRQLVALEQGIWDAWSDYRAPSGTVAAAPPASTYPATICGGIMLPANIPISDPYMGVSSSLMWDSGSSKWLLCANVVNWASTGINFALHYSWDGSTSGFTLSWKGSGTFQPVASVCSDTTTYNNIPLSHTTTVCPPPTLTVTYVANSASATSIKTLYQSSTTTRTVTLGPV